MFHGYCDLPEVRNQYAQQGANNMELYKPGDTQDCFYNIQYVCEVKMGFPLSQFATRGYLKVIYFETITVSSSDFESSQEPSSLRYVGCVSTRAVAHSHRMYPDNI